MINNLLDELLDVGSFRQWDDGTPESVVTGGGLLAGHRVAVVASDFSFQGGSIGLVAGERLTRAVERATAQRRALIALPASGGTRMQEGTLAFLQMLKVTAAISTHKAVGLPYIAYLRHPTTGGVLASWASLAHVTLAEPGALIGFLGPRAAEAITGQPFPAGVQTAENLHAHGLVDAVVPLPGLSGHLAGVLDALGAPSVHPLSRWAERNVPSPPPSLLPMPVRAGGPDAWECVRLTRAPGYRAAQVLREAAPRLAVLAEAGGLLLAAGQLGRTRAVVVAQDGVGAFGIDGVRLARRGMLLAAELELPLVTMIDTPGAELSAAAEEGGLAREIAQTLALLVGLPVPTVAVLLGQGAGAGALALLPADRILADWCAWLAPLAPEGASAIVYRDTAHAPELARAQRIRAVDLAARHVVDEVAPNELEWPKTLADTLIDELASLTALGVSERLASRRRRLRTLGVPPR